MRYTHFYILSLMLHFEFSHSLPHKMRFVNTLFKKISLIFTIFFIFDNFRPFFRTF